MGNNLKEKFSQTPTDHAEYKKQAIIVVVVLVVVAVAVIVLASPFRG